MRNGVLTSAAVFASITVALVSEAAGAAGVSVFTTRFIPHLGQRPRLRDVTSGCIGQAY